MGSAWGDWQGDISATDTRASLRDTSDFGDSGGDKEALAACGGKGCGGEVLARLGDLGVCSPLFLLLRVLVCSIRKTNTKQIYLQM